MRRTVFEEEHELFRQSFRAFLDKEVVPHHLEWERAGIVPHELFGSAGRAGFLGISLPERHGGAGVRDFRFNYVMHEFGYLSHNLPQERLAIATIAVAAARAAFDLTLDYVKQRKAFGQPIGSFQNSRFAMAEMLSEIAIAQAYVDQCVLAHTGGELTAQEAAMAKWWCAELQNRVADRCLQLHGGYGYMSEYPIARAFVDARIQKIYGGTNEIMKEIIGRSIGL